MPSVPKETKELRYRSACAAFQYVMLGDDDVCYDIIKQTYNAVKHAAREYLDTNPNQDCREEVLSFVGKATMMMEDLKTISRS